MATKLRLGDLLVQKGKISSAQLKQALDEQKSTGRKLGSILIKLDFIQEDELLNILSEQLKIPYIQLQHYSIKTAFIKEIPERFARRYRLILIDKLAGSYLLGMVDPTDLLAFDEISRLLKSPIRRAVVKESELLTVLEQAYKTSDEMSNIAMELDEELSDGDSHIQEEQMEGSKIPVMKMLESIFKGAVQSKASDIHIEPGEKNLRVRQRIDGVLNETVMDQKQIASALVLRLKLMAHLNISEKRLPQDGRFHLTVMGKRIDVRLSTMPVQHGESVVMRLLDHSSSIYSLEQLGFPDDIFHSIKKYIAKPHGMILVTGPTGSGKTTTLYTCLSELNKKEKKIITVEDPVEYSIDRINQVQVNAKISLTFSKVLRAALRQDPDVVMVGEMRDQETAAIGLRAAITGHLVLSTLHTNDAISCAVRLIDMGVEGYLVATALQCVIAQRLVRKICTECITEYNPEPQELSWVSATSGKPKSDCKLYIGKGCRYCDNSGYNGRVGVYEVLEFSGAVVDALRVGDTAEFSRLAARSENYKPLAHYALDYALEGITSLDEVLRIAGEIAEDEDLYAVDTDAKLGDGSTI